ncbi:3-oxoacyl-[acyl-carrier protein] reductase [Motilibacter rhizosphaerae]|uniref:3-oxoacyl-[acyl-carrier protein] reductase n=1 Tax=Motilibacter rhizosphaerae TaxID=598652 RepID=A0A4Q7NGB0_9ACTN|nr:SDR family oxidoreductase [Motilibacter rhizosphaerae]RZS82778.1 3-oxoacyl-[acyl-carrier protein] reductase [Motilibacter rhizosphaerae]
MDLGLAGRVYVVTGGSRGLGYATARALVAEGAQVALCSRDETTLRAAADTLGGPDHALAVAGDIAEPGTPTRLVAAAAARYGHVDGALISVGGPEPGAALALSDEQWRAGFESVFLGPLHVVRALATEITPGGSIALVLSTSVRSPIEGLAISNALRPALAMTTKSLADELGPRSIRVNGLLPGRIDTDRLRELEVAGGRPVTSRREWERQVPLGRYGDPLEFGKVAAFVLSPASSYVTGAMIPVDGGLSRSF